MPRMGRASTGGLCCHVLNRGNGRMRVFHDEQDYAAFVELLGEACSRVNVRVLGCCLMPNHFHLVLWPGHDGDLARWMQWLMTSHVRRYHRRYGTSGHVWQGRFKSFPVQRREPTASERAAGAVEIGDPVLTVLRYVERNPLRANQVARAQAWPFSSLRWWHEPTCRPEWVDPAWLARPDDWLAWVNRPQSEAELAGVRRSVQRGTPLGSDRWVRRIATALGLESTLRPRGRPRKEPSPESGPPKK
ncbi:MAG: transposase [Planctomycetota bacterium]|nr:transposase [Planctomycetota bacterium]